MALEAILGNDPNFGDNFSLREDSTRGAARLPGKFSLLSFYLEILLIYSYFLVNFLLYIFNLSLYLISHLIYSLIILFSL